MKRPIVWLASYPKSGNTWVRVFLTNYLRNAPDPADIESLDVGRLVARRDLFDAVIGVESSDLTQEEITLLRPDVYRQMAVDAHGLLFLKVHDAFIDAGCGAPVFPSDVTRAAIYIIRNPLDIAVSLAHHRGVSLDRVIDAMSRDDEVLGGEHARLQQQLPQPVLSWSHHVESWVDRSAMPTHVVRFEDMVHVPEPTFSSVVESCGLVVNGERVQRAIEFSRFERLQDQERQHGFRERPSESVLFFRRGRVGDWRNHLAEAQVARIIEQHEVTMRRFGYLSADGTLPLV